MMITRQWKLLIGSALLLAIAGLAFLGVISGAIAAPGLAPARVVQAAPMGVLSEATSCSLDTLTNIRTCELWASAGSLTMPDGAVVPIWGFSDRDPALDGTPGLPGPLIRANAGETLEIVLNNGLAEEVALAFPGQEGVPDLVGALPASQIAAELGVNHILEGSIQRERDRIRVTAQLIAAATGFHLWSETYD